MTDQSKFLKIRLNAYHPSESYCPKHTEFEELDDRIRSFSNWPSNIIQRPEQLPSAGFYYTGKEDIVRCFFCDIDLAEWASDDDPWVEHARHSPSCLFVIEKRGRAFVENIQQIYCPKHTEFEELSARIRSFSNWPSHIIQRPEKLASAGFYYTGKTDEVRCHYCSGGLKGWEEDDEPWTEHARWFPSCKFLIKSKGSVYVEEIARARKYNNNHVKDSSSRTRGQDDQSRARPRDEIVAKHLLEMGFSKVKVKNAINEHIKRTDADLLLSGNWRNGSNSCSFCKDKPRCMTFYPCGHRLVCETCSELFELCFQCRKSIERSVQTY